MVGPAGLAMLAAEIVIGCAPDGVSEASWRFICCTPLTSPGAAPLYRIAAVFPPTAAVIEPSKGAGAALTAPVAPGGFVWPPPVKKIVITEPAAAGLAALFALPS